MEAANPSQILQNLVLEHPSQCNYAELAANPIVPFEFIEKIGQAAFKYRDLNPNIKPEEITTYSDPVFLSLNPSVSPQFFVQFYAEWRVKNRISTYTVSHLSANRSLTFSFVLEKYHLEWDWEQLMKNPNIDWKNYDPSMYIGKSRLPLSWLWKWISSSPKLVFEDILNYAGFVSWSRLSANPAISIETVNKYPQFPWDHQWLSMNPNIKLPDVRKNPQIKWNWYWLTQTISIGDIINHPKLPWDYTGIHLNKDFTLEHLLRHGVKTSIKWYESSRDNIIFRYEHNTAWDWGEISSSKLISIELVVKLMHFPWNWFRLSRNPNIKFKDIMVHPELPWEADGVSLNPSVTLQDVANNPTFRWCYDCISGKTE